MISEIEGQINYKKKDDYVGNYGKEFGNSAAHISDFIFDIKQLAIIIIKHGKSYYKVSNSYICS